MTALVFLVLQMDCYAVEDTRILEMKVNVGRGTGDDPMVVIWLETDVGEYVKTIHMFSHDKEYYHEMLAWKFRSRKRKTSNEVDGVTSATINWKRSKTIRIPVDAGDFNLLDGNHIIRIESRQWKGKHYRQFKIPLSEDYQGGVHESPGHVKSITIKLKEQVSADEGAGK